MMITARVMIGRLGPEAQLEGNQHKLIVEAYSSRIILLTKW